MEVVKVTRNFQVTIPASVRERLGIREGDLLEVYVEGDKVVFRKAGGDRRRLVLGRRLTLEDVERAIAAGAGEGWRP